MSTGVYAAFLLRLWQAGAPGNQHWRASLENPHTHQVMGFDSIASLCGYLENLAHPGEARASDETMDGLNFNNIQTPTKGNHP